VRKALPTSVSSRGRRLERAVTRSLDEESFEVDGVEERPDLRK
jgi:hypothetical protein